MLLNITLERSIGIEHKAYDNARIGNIIHRPFVIDDRYNIQNKIRYVALPHAVDQIADDPSYNQPEGELHKRLIEFEELSENRDSRQKDKGQDDEQPAKALKLAKGCPPIAYMHDVEVIGDDLNRVRPDVGLEGNLYAYPRLRRLICNENHQGQPQKELVCFDESEQRRVVRERAG